MDGMGPRVKKIKYDPKSPQEKDLINMYDKENIRSSDIKFGLIAIGGFILIVAAAILVPWTVGKIGDLWDEDDDRSRLVVGDLVNQDPGAPSGYQNARSFYVYIQNEGPGTANDIVASFTVEYFNDTSLIGKSTVTERLGSLPKGIDNPVSSEGVPADASYYVITLHLSWDDGSLTFTWTR